MKKLLVFAIAATFAVVSQAAQFEWSASQVREGWDDPNNKASGTAYLFLVAGDVTEASIASAISGATSSSTLATTLQGKAIDTQSLTTGSTGGTTAEGIDATAPASLFFVVISGDNVYQSAATTVSEIATIGSTSLAFGSQKTATSVASAWSSVGGGSDPGGVPEPTSGLLLLVGAGMLALRRKQK